MRYSENDKEKLDAAIKQRDKIEPKNGEKSSDKTDDSDKKGEKSKNEPDKKLSSEKSEGIDSENAEESPDENSESPKKFDSYDRITKNPFKRMKYDREQIAEEMKDMSFWGKVKYIFYYYKWHMFVTLIVLFVIFEVISIIYQNSRPVAISYVIINSYSLDDTLNTDIFTDYADYYQFDNGYKTDSVVDIILDFEKYKENSEYLINNYRYMSFSTYCSENYFDILFTDRSGLDVCSARSHVYPVDQILNEENFEKCKSQGRLTASTGYGGDIGYFAIDISDIPAVKAMNLRYTEIYLAFPGKSQQNIDNANRFVSYILK